MARRKISCARRKIASWRPRPTIALRIGPADKRDPRLHTGSRRSAITPDPSFPAPTFRGPTFSASIFPDQSLEVSAAEPPTERPSASRRSAVKSVRGTTSKLSENRGERQIYQSKQSLSAIHFLSKCGQKGWGGNAKIVKRRAAGPERCIPLPSVKVVSLRVAEAKTSTTAPICGSRLSSE